MQDSELISVRVPKKTAARLKKLAKTTDRSKSYLAAQAIEGYLTENEEYERMIKEGIESADKGNLISHEAVMKFIKAGFK